MCSINHLYNACHIKCYYDCGLESVSAVLKLAWFQDCQAALGSPRHHQSIYGAIHACLCVSECKFENGSCALSWISPALAGQRPGTDSQKFHGDISEAVSEQSVWLSTLIKQHSVVVWITLLNNAGVIPGNRPVESWITPVLIVLPSNLAGVALRRALREQNMKPERSVLWWNLEWLHMFSLNLCQRHWTTVWTVPDLTTKASCGFCVGGFTIWLQ